MYKIVECVPNVSDGVNPDIYNTIAKSCEKISGVKLLDVDPGKATNRTVITFAGPPELIVDAAFEVIKTSKELIDMRNHSGEHPRMGATDVCPFVPVSGVTLEDCAELARMLAKRVGEELGVWTYLYEAAATKDEWKNLPNVRKGEYEGLAAREGSSEWKPDFGSLKFDPKFGAVAIGARKFLVAYNINVNASNKKWAQDIAFNIRESGRSKRVSYPDGEIIRNSDGTPVKIPGMFKHCKGGAWVIPEYNRAQVTMNLTDIDETPLHIVFDEVCRQAYERGVRVTGSEIVGLVPKKTLVDAGIHFLRKQGFSIAVSEKDIIDTAIMSLGLSDVAPFEPNNKIVEYCLKENTEKLVDQRITEFCNTLASDAPAPGGGSVAALLGALSASLFTMVTNLTHGKLQYKENWERMEAIGILGQDYKIWFIDAIDRDTDAFNLVVDAMRLPKKSEREKNLREKALEEAYKKATQVPFEVLEKCLQMTELIKEVVEKGNPNCASDGGVAATCMLSCAQGAGLNVKINLQNISDKEFISSYSLKVEKLLEAAGKECGSILSEVNKKI